MTVPITGECPGLAAGTRFFSGPVRKLPRIDTNTGRLTNLRINVEFFELNGAEFYIAVVAEIVQPLVLGTPGRGLPTQGRVIG